MEAKGTAVQIVPLFVKERFGEEGHDNWLAALDPSSRDLFSKRIRISSWYPIAQSLLIPTRVAADLFFDDPEEGAKEMGRFSASHTLRGVYKSLIRLGSTRWIISRGSQAINLYYRPAKSEMEVINAKKVVFRILSFPETSVLLEARNMGWIEEAGALSGAKDVEVEKTHSLAEGDALTEFVVTWT